MKCPNCGNQMKSKFRDYEYTESGLKNVILKNIRVYECKECGEILPEIQNVKRIHDWIAEYLVKKQSPLTGPEFRFLRKQMSMGAAQVGQLLGVTHVTISRWENNREKIGPQSDRLIRMLAIAHPGKHSPVKKLMNEVLTTFLSLKVTEERPKPARIVISEERRVHE